MSPAKQEPKTRASGSLGTTNSDCATKSSQELGRRRQPKLQDLIHIAVAIAAGCESCAEAAVTRALNQGSSPRHIEETLRIVTHMQNLECFIQAVGPDVVARMEKPSSVAARTLQQAAAASV